MKKEYSDTMNEEHTKGPQDDRWREAPPPCCPSCKRPYFPHPSYPSHLSYPSHPSYPPYPRSFGYEKTLFGIRLKNWIIILVVFLFIGLPFSFFILMLSYEGSEERTETYSSEATIGEGGHFRYTLGGSYYDELEVAIEISSHNASYFDIYIMDEDQYENSYGIFKDDENSFSATYMNENVTFMNDTVTLPELPRYDNNYYLVIDNRETSLTPDDADPKGTINVSMKITETYHYDRD